MTAVAEPVARSDAGLRSRLRPVLALARPWHRDLRHGLASGITQQVLFMAGTAIAAYAVGRAVRGATYYDLTFYLLGLVVIVLPQVRTPWLEAISLQAIGNRAQVRLRDRLFAALEALTPAGLAGRRSGDLGSTAMADVAAVQRFFAETLSTVVTGAVVPALGLAAIAVMSWRLALVLLPFVVAAAVVPGRLHHRSQPRGAAVRDALAGLSAEIIDAVQGLREIVTFGAEDAVLAELAERARRAERVSSGAAGLALLPRVAAEILNATGAVALLGVGAYLVGHHRLSPTLLPPCAVLGALAVAPVAGLVEAATSLDRVAAAGQRIFAVTDAPHPVLDRTVTHRPSSTGRTATEIEFRNVRFRYGPALPLALDDVSFGVGRHETVALVGHSGAGKSTCANLLLRFWDPQGGSVALGGDDLRDIPQVELHRVVGLVSQDVYLFNTTVRENLRLGRPDARDSQIEQAARQARAWEFIAALPEGLDTETGERGVRLSGGQRQRLAIARAVLADPPVLVLDEAVSNLDSENEAALTRAMSDLRTGRTTLIVAHRLSTIRSADRIVVLERGRVAGTGTHSELIAANRVYASLVAAQRP